MISFLPCARPAAGRLEAGALSTYRGEYDLEVVCAPRWTASSSTFSVRSIWVKVRVIES
jgi:hypothetical protein